MTHPYASIAEVPCKSAEAREQRRDDRAKADARPREERPEGSKPSQGFVPQNRCVNSPVLIHPAVRENVRRQRRNEPAVEGGFSGREMADGRLESGARWLSRGLLPLLFVPNQLPRAKLGGPLSAGSLLLRSESHVPVSSGAYSWKKTAMAHYLIQGRYTAASSRSLVCQPRDRGAQVRSLVESLGGTMHQFFFALGEADFVMLCELPDDVSALSLSLAGSGAGGVEQIHTTRLFTSEEGMAAMTMAQQAEYAPPGVVLSA